MSIRFGTALIGMTVMMATAIPAARAEPTVDPAFCRELVKHMPRADVRYQEGVDVNGKPVAPADLPGQPRIDIPDVIKIPLTLDLARALNLNTSAYPYDALGMGTEVSLGVLSIEDDRVEFNGQPISDVQQDRLAVLCMEPK